MTVELKIPQAGESITEVEIGQWKKAEGDVVRRDEAIVEVQTDKASMELPSPVDGKISRILKKTGDLVHVGDVVALFEEGPVAVTTSPKAAPQAAQRPVSAAPQSSSAAKASTAATSQPSAGVVGDRMGPAARRAMREHQPAAAAAPRPAPSSVPTAAPAKPASPVQLAGDRPEEIVPMTLLRRKIAERLVEAQHAGALLTTFNEVDMQAVTALRKEYQQAFLEKYQVKLGFMSFFIKAAVEALKAVPQVNAEIRGTDIVFKNYFDIGVAVGSGKGLVVPVIRHADRLSFADLERVIADYGARARENRLNIDELQGGTFTISNGGIYGSMLSTPIINPPQSGILGMHAIQERAVVRAGEVVIRPMMYLALTYDHRVVDGREAVTFLKRIKDLLETPARLLLEI